MVSLPLLKTAFYSMGDTREKVLRLGVEGVARP
jgi:hypothetical protein